MALFDLDHWQEIWAALTQNKLRTLLTAFGVFWGIFLLVVLLGAANGLSNATERGFSGVATNSFFVWSRTTTKPYRGLPPGRRPQMTNEDVEAVRREVPEVKVVAPRNQLGGFGDGNNVTRGTRSGAFDVMGDEPQILTLNSLDITQGRFLNPRDLEERRKVAVIGSRVREVLFEPDEDPVGLNIHIQGVYFKVVGVFQSRQLGNRRDRTPETIHIPFTTFQQAFNYGRRVSWLAVTSADNVPASVAEEKVLAFMAARHKVAPDDRRAFGHFNLEQQFNQVTSLFTGIGILTWIVGIGTLAAGAVGVSNIMLIIVRERTREIGIRRAVGARPRTIVGQVLFESVLLTATAGIFGLLAGVGLLEVAAAALPSGGNAPMQNPGVSFENALQALTILVVAGTLAGLMPAFRAVSVAPVEALRAE